MVLKKHIFIYTEELIKVLCEDYNVYKNFKILKDEEKSIWKIRIEMCGWEDFRVVATYV